MTGVGSTLGGEAVAQLQDGDDTYTALLRAMGITI